jgi:hypothetical protein
MSVNDLQYLIGQRGSSFERQKSLGMLLQLGELPGTDWRIRGERFWRTRFVLRERSNTSCSLSSAPGSSGTT